jgi:hypothetical protein
MKLITEYTENNLSSMTEEVDGEKNVYIEGIFMQAEKKNRNGRIYERRVIIPAVERYVSEQVVTGRAVGELNHPEGPTVNLDKVSHRITNLQWEGNDCIGKALILNTPMGQIVKGLVEGGVKLGVLSCGMGSLVSKGGHNYVAEDYILNTVDIVQDPSAHDAFVNGIMEGADWCWNNGVLVQEVEKIETEVKQASTSDLRSGNVQMKAFKDFLSKL